MEATIHYIRQIIELLNQAEEEYKACSKQISQLDLEAQDILHQHRQNCQVSSLS